MKTKRTKKRYLTANQIRDEIDQFKQKALRSVQEAEGLELSARDMAAYPNMKEDMVWRLEQAKKARRRAQRINDIKLPKLKQKLAEWQTEIMPSIITDGDRRVSA